MPDDCGSTTVSASSVAPIASMALPPCLSIASPAAVAARIGGGHGIGIANRRRLLGSGDGGQAGAGQDESEKGGFHEA